MNIISKLTDRLLSDEPLHPFDYEPQDLSLVEPDDPKDAMPDQGDKVEVEA